MIDQIRREIARAFAGVRSAFRGTVSNMTLDGGAQKVGVAGLSGESVPDVELLQQFGFTSAPPDGASVILLPLGGRTSASVVVATEHGAYRLQLNNRGEAAMYSQWGDHVWMKQGGVIDVQASTAVHINAPIITATGDLDVAGNIHAGGNIVANGDMADQGGAKTMAGMRAAYNAHHNGAGTSTPDVGM